ncbi:MAG: LLM class flavin-dependent oxidoreductase [Actinobacteria bacterium]|nr:LLM class flavin-dependent oxidoreductase [Actinomycetota bacterium]
MRQVRHPAGTALALRDPLPWAGFAALARRGEELGYVAVFLPEIAGRDVFAALMGLAGETTEMLLGTGIVPMAARTPMLTAMAAATVQERSGGRAILGIGTGPASAGTLERLRAEVASLRALLAGEAVDGRSLSLLPGTPVPIWISALGPRAVRLAGEVADGVLLNCCTPERVAEAHAAVREAAEAAGRDPGAVAVGVYVRSCLWGDQEASLLAMKEALGQYASFPAYARQFERMGFGDEARRAAAAYVAGRPGDVPESFARRLGLLGDPAAARERFRAFTEAGADVPVVYMVAAPGDPEASLRATLEALAPG